MLALLNLMKRKLKWIFGALVVVFGLLQFTNPARTNPPVVNDLAATNPPPPEIAALLRAACYDCHSHETKWPLYSRIAPASWLVVSDVNEGRTASEFFRLADRPRRRRQKTGPHQRSSRLPRNAAEKIHAAPSRSAAHRRPAQATLDWSDATANKLHASTNQ